MRESIQRLARDPPPMLPRERCGLDRGRDHDSNTQMVAYLAAFGGLVLQSIAVCTRKKLLALGISRDRFMVKPNFVWNDPGAGTGSGGYVVFAGRLSAEKGLNVLLDAWRGKPSLPELRIAGDGPLAEEVRAASASDPRIHCLGNLPHDELLELLGDAVALVMPSIWYETFGRTIVEAYSRGTPAVVSRMGSMAELVDDGRTGFSVPPGDADALANAITRLVTSPELSQDMRSAARAEFEEKYTPEENYGILLEMYRRAGVASVPEAVEAVRITLERDHVDLSSPLVEASGMGCNGCRILAVLGWCGDQQNTSAIRKSLTSLLCCGLYV